MFVVVLLLLLLFVGAFFVFISSYSFQIFFHKFFTKHTFLESFVARVKGEIIPAGFFVISHSIVEPNEYKTLSLRHKTLFSSCYNIVTFKTPDAKWELFFHLVREGLGYNEILTLRCFPHSHKIRSEGNVEKNYSRLNIFTNNRYLTQVLETQEARNLLSSMIENNSDIMHITHNNIHLKIFMDKKTGGPELQKIMNIVRSMNQLKTMIFKEDVIEY